MIRAQGLTKVYGDFAAVDGIDFHVTQGESFGILGPNGAGKSTTMRMLGATLQRTSGELLDPRPRPVRTRGRPSAPTSASCRSRTTSTPS